MLTGLTDQDVSRRQKKYGSNSVQRRQVAWFAVLTRQFNSPFFYLLAFAASLSLYLGQVSNAVLIGMFIGINTIFGFYQEYRAERTIADLARIVAPKATVRRNGRVQEVFTSELVPGDVVLLEPGDIVPADLQLADVQDLVIDEAVLTGESMPVEKLVNQTAYAGTTIVTGTAVGTVAAIGAESALGSLAARAGAVRHESLYARNIKTFTLLMMVLIGVTLTGIIVLHTAFRPSGMELTSLILFAIALAVSILPEGLPLVMTFCLARGAARLAQQRVVSKRLSAIEDLGSITVLCTDKTGTLTENNLSVADVFGEREVVLAAAINVNQLVLTERKDAARSFDEALVKASAAQHPQGDRVLYLPFDHRHYCSHAVISHEAGATAFIRGVPEAIMKRCATVEQAWAAWAHQQGSLGRRVIAVASKAVAHDLSSSDLVGLQGFTLLGLISFEDVIKQTAADAVQKAQAMGIAVKLITGDTPEVAGAVAHSIGLIDSPDQVITPEHLQAVSPDKRIALYQQYAVFARMSPQQKYELVEGLQTVAAVGFMGEGVNDAPALKAAHVALVVENGTDIAKDAADLILLDKSLSVIIDGIAEGRRIVANTIKYIQLMLICNTSNFYSIAVASLLIDFLPMTPLQILLVNVLSDFPLIAIATDHVAPEDIAQPQQYHFSSILKKALFFGMIGSLLDFVVFRMYYRKPALLQTVWFMYSICSELIMFYVMRTRKFFLFGHRPPLFLMALSGLSALATVSLPISVVSRYCFGFVQPPWTAWVFFGGLLVAWLLAMEAVKVAYRKWVGD